MRLHNDEPTLLDRLDRRDLLQRLGDEVATCDPPHVFGVHGDWGSGKTSFLHQLQAYLTDGCPQQSDDNLDQLRRECQTLQWGVHKERVTVVWFEAWRYQHERAPVIALLQEIRTQLPWYAQALEKTKKLGEVAIRSALLAFEDLTKKIGIQASKIQEAGEKWEQDHLATVLPSHMIRQHLKHALETLLGDSGNRLVVMIDDLDRCSSQSAYKLLEGIKIYLNLPNCVFVLGMNQRIIESAIAEHIPKTDDLAIHALRAREYLDKLCQTIVHLPIPREPALLLKTYLKDLPSADWVCEVIDDYDCLPVNPRKIKGYANLLLRYAPRFEPKMTEPSQARICASLIVIFSCLYHFHPDLYRLVEAYPEFYGRVHRWAEQDATQVPHPIFSGLARTEFDRRRPPSGKAEISPETDRNETSPTAEIIWEAAFADPAEGNVLRIQTLIRDVGPVTLSDVREYLVR